MSSPSEMYAAIPPVSKVWFTSAIASSLLARFSLVDPSLLLLNWPAVWNKWQVWRLPASAVFFGEPSFGWIITMMMLYRFSQALEQSPYPSGGGAHNGNVADFVWMLLVGFALILPAAAATGLMVSSYSLLMMVIYVWSKRHPGQQVTFYMFRIESKYLPWVMVAFSFIVRDDIIKDLVGIAAGHIYYFLQEEVDSVESPLKGWRLLRTPDWLCAWMGVTPTHVPAAVMRMQQRAGGGAQQPGVAGGRPAHQWGTGNALGR